MTTAQIFSALVWKLLERGGTQGIQLVVMIVLTRMLLPEDYGVIAIVAVFISMATLLVDSGFYEALIQKKDTDDTDFSSVFYINVLMATVLYCVLFFSAPAIALFFQMAELIAVVRVLGLVLFFSAFYSVQQAIMAKSLQFKKLFMSSLVAVICSGTVGLLLAYLGGGVWALVGQQLVSQCVLAWMLWIKVGWRPKLVFSLERVRQLFAYGGRLVAATFIYNVYTHGQSFLIGKLFNPAMLGFYSRGMLLPNILVSNLNGSIQSVMFPAMAAQEHGRMKQMVRRTIGVSTFIVFPLMLLLGVIAKPLVIVLFTAKWLPAVPFLQIFCAYYALWAIDATHLQAIKALGRSDIFLKLEMLKFLCGVLILLVTLPFGIYAMAVGVLFNRIVTTVLDAYPNRLFLKYSWQQQVMDIYPSLLLAIATGVVIYPLQFLLVSASWTIFVQVLVGMIVYLGFARLLQIESYLYMVSSLKLLIRHRKEKAVI